MPYGPAVPLMGIYPKELKTYSQWDTPRSFQHYAQEPRYGNNPVSVDGWMEKEGVVCMCNGVFIQAWERRKFWICDNMDVRALC